jgi:hypothetical protein
MLRNHRRAAETTRERVKHERRRFEAVRFS